MATIAENIQTLRSIKSDIKNAIIQKGGSVTDAFGTYAQAITNLPSGGGNEDLINLIERDVTTLNIPDGTTKIGDYAFYSYKGINEITIPDTVTSIGDYAFAESTITSVTIPSSMKYIYAHAFDCPALISITVLATTPPVIGRAALGNPGDCPIYVPAASVDAYKTADNWVNYANYIYAIGNITEGPEIGGNPSGGEEAGGGDIL